MTMGNSLVLGNESWPAQLWVVRHAESEGNAARVAALKAGALTIAVPARDPDVPLSARGLEQARALGRWFGREVAVPPTAILTSPFRRTLETTATVAEAAGWALVEADEAGATAEAEAPAGPAAGERGAIRLIVDE